jgi:hypothetical protein
LVATITKWILPQLFLKAVINDNPVQGLPEVDLAVVTVRSLTLEISVEKTWSAGGFLRTTKQLSLSLSPGMGRSEARRDEHFRR